MADKTLVSQYDGTTVKVGDTFRRYDKGAVVPPEADADHVKVLVDRGMLAEGEAVAGATGVDPDVPPPFPLPDEADQPDKAAGRSRRAPADDKQ